MVGEQSKHWVFTLNNYTTNDVDRILTLGGAVRYLVVGREVGAQGTPHLQGFVSFVQRKRLAQVKSVLGGNPHVEIARDPPGAIVYCKKDGDWDEIGEAPAGSGSRSDLNAFKDAVKSGEHNLEVLMETHSKVVARYKTFCKDYIRIHQKPEPVTTHALYPWQQSLNRKLLLAPDDRKIVFVVDVLGNVGKSWFGRYYLQLHPENTQIIRVGKKMDMAYELRTTSRVVFVDCARSKATDHLQYDFLEEMKDGMVFSAKYESHMKFMKPPHVVVLMNQQPDMTKLSADRYEIINLN